MGSGICGAIGVALADRGTPVVCFCGDGGLMMKGMELLLAVQHRLPILYAVFNDRRYNMVFHGMKKLYGVEIDCEQPALDFQAWGTSLGLRSRTIHAVEELQDLPLETWLQEGPCLLDIHIDRDQVLEGAGRNERLQLMSQGSGGSA
jgi:acetolactate synthase I/II/III large subunit